MPGMTVASPLTLCARRVAAHQGRAMAVECRNRRSRVRCTVNTPPKGPGMADTVANWIMAVTTTLALGAAMWAGHTARRLYAIEQHRDQDRQLAEERKQADLVASWVSWSQQPVPLSLPSGRTSRATLAVQNGSAVPIYDVCVTYFETEAILGPQHFHMISPTGFAAHYREIKSNGVLLRLDEPRERDVRLDIRVSIAFTDASGTRWTREPSGQLLKVAT